MNETIIKKSLRDPMSQSDQDPFFVFLGPAGGFGRYQYQYKIDQKRIKQEMLMLFQCLNRIKIVLPKHLRLYIYNIYLKKEEENVKTRAIVDELFTTYMLDRTFY